MIFAKVTPDELIPDLISEGGDWRRFFQEKEGFFYCSLKQIRVSQTLYLQIGERLGWPDTPNPRHIT